MYESLTIILFSFCLLIGCYIFGILPLVLPIPENKIKFLTIFGAGLLVSTALTIIIPEGFNSMIKSCDIINDQAAHKELDHKHHSDHANSNSDSHKYCGVAMLLGFVFMFIVDHIGSRNKNGDSKNRSTATTGLVIHAAADGMALGAASSSSHFHVEIIVFLAIMLHKAPAAFGLVTFLLHEGLDRSKIKRHLLIFSLSSPFFSLLTYYGLAQTSKETLSTLNATGLALLFSGGTFLYVSTVHIIPELTRLGNIQTQTALPDNVITIHEHKGFNTKELFCIVVGCILPLFLAIGHQH